MQDVSAGRKQQRAFRGIARALLAGPCGSLCDSSQEVRTPSRKRRSSRMARKDPQTQADIEWKDEQSDAYIELAFRNVPEPLDIQMAGAGFQSICAAHQSPYGDKALNCEGPGKVRYRSIQRSPAN